MARATRTLLDEATTRLSRCGACPARERCVFTSSTYQPGRCLHEYKLLHAFAHRRARGAHDAAGWARVAEEVRRYGQWLKDVRPFDPADEALVVPHGPDVPFDDTAQATLSAFTTSSR